MYSLMRNFLLLMIFLKHSLSHLCELCNCDQSMDVVEVKCDCRIEKHLHFTSSLMSNYKFVRKIDVTNCQVLIIERNCFLPLHAMESLKIENSQHLFISIGSFTKIDYLWINNVSDVSFGDMAFMGSRDIKHVFVKSVNINNINSDIFSDMKELEEFHLSNVNIGLIDKNSLNISSRSVIIENCKIDEIQQQGFSIRSEKTIIRKTIFKTIHPQAVAIFSADIKLSDNYFKDTFNFDIRAASAYFSRNHFKHLDVGSVRDIEKSIFTNNFIYDVNFKHIYNSYHNATFYDNVFACECNMSLLNHTKELNYAVALRNNYCQLDCAVSLFDFELKASLFCSRNERDNKCDKYFNTTKIASKRESIKSSLPLNRANQNFLELVIFLILLLNYLHIT